MSEAALWLIYCLSAAIASLVVYARGWRMVSAMLLGTVIGLAVYLLVSLAKGGALDDPLLEAALLVNGSFCLIFAAAGAALGFALSRRSGGS